MPQREAGASVKGGAAASVVLVFLGPQLPSLSRILHPVAPCSLGTSGMVLFPFMHKPVWTLGDITRVGQKLQSPLLASPFLWRVV